jgi:hypothetical protein
VTKAAKTTTKKGSVESVPEPSSLVSSAKNFDKIWKEGVQAGKKAVLANAKNVPEYRIVDDPMSATYRKGGNNYAPLRGTFGFVMFSVDGRSAFGKWALKKGIGYKGYKGIGISINTDIPKMDMLEDKEAYARALGKVLTDNGIEYEYKSRMD